MNPSRPVLAPGVFFAWLGLASGTFASIDIVNNLSATTGGYDSRALDFGQVFATPGSSGQMSGFTVSIGASTASETVTFYLYDTDSTGAPTGSGTSLGDITISAAGNYSLALASGPNLAANTAYAIVMSNPVGVGGPEYWNWTASASSGVTGTPPLGGIYRGSAHGGGSQSWSQIDAGDYFQMEIQTVPEVPKTGALMGLGALAVAAGGVLRRKWPATKSVRGV